MNIREEMEFNNIRHFLITNYNIDIGLDDEGISPLIKSAVNFFFSLNTWEDYIYESPLINDDLKSMFREVISNSLHIISFSALKMRLPILMMINRSIELMILFFFSTEIKSKESDEESILKKADYMDLLIERYSFESKYDVDIEKVSEFCEEMVRVLNIQYLELSKYLSFKNAKYFSNEKCLDIMNWSKLDILYLENQIILISSIINNILIILYFDLYIEKIPEGKKLFIRSSISSKYDYKNKIREIFHEF